MIVPVLLAVLIVVALLLAVAMVLVAIGGESEEGRSSR